MAANLITAGHEVTVYKRSRDKLAPLMALVATAAAGIADPCAGDAVITMLADDHAIESVVSGEGGVPASLSPDAVHVSCGAISVALSRRLAQAHQARSPHRYSAARKPPRRRNLDWSAVGRPVAQDAGAP